MFSAHQSRNFKKNRKEFMTRTNSTEKLFQYLTNEFIVFPDYYYVIYSITLVTVRWIIKELD